MWQDIFFKVDKTFDILLKGYCYRMDYIKKVTNWNIPSTPKKVPTCWVCPIDGHCTKGRNNRFEGCGNPLPPRGDIEEMVSGGGDRNLLNDMELHAWMSSTPLEPFQIPLLDYTCMFWRSYHHIRYKAYSNSPDLVVTTPCIGHSQIYFLIQLFGLFFSFCFPLSNKLAWRSKAPTHCNPL